MEFSSKLKLNFLWKIRGILLIHLVTHCMHLEMTCCLRFKLKGLKFTVTTNTQIVAEDSFIPVSGGFQHFLALII